MQTDVALKVRRSWLAAFHFRLFRPNDAKAAAVNASALILTFASTSRAIALGDIETVEVEHGRYWGGIQVGCASGKALVSGLTKGDAAALADALEAARTHWWRDAIATRTELLQSVDERLMALSSPLRYVRHSVFQELKRDAESVAESFSARWPDSLTGTREIQMLSEIQAFLRTPDGFRERTNEWFVADEIRLYRPFFDRVEVQPLSDEQRRAVVIDEDRNLVVAAAGSGKTSVIVAKAGWLTWREYCQPEELLVLAYGKGAQKDSGEADQRPTRRRTGEPPDRTDVSQPRQEDYRRSRGTSSRPWPRWLEDEKALSELLRDIVEGLLGDEKLSRIVRHWFQEFFSPYRSQHEFKQLGRVLELHPRARNPLPAG